MSNIASSNSLVDKLTLISDLNGLLVLDDYGWSFVAKLNWKKKNFFLKHLFFTKYTLVGEKNIFISKKTFLQRKI